MVSPLVTCFRGESEVLVKADPLASRHFRLPAFGSQDGSPEQRSPRQVFDRRNLRRRSNRRQPCPHQHVRPGIASFSHALQRIRADRVIRPSRQPHPDLAAHHHYPPREARSVQGIERPPSQHRHQPRCAFSLRLPRLSPTPLTPPRPPRRPDRRLAARVPAARDRGLPVARFDRPEKAREAVPRLAVQDGRVLQGVVRSRGCREILYRRDFQQKERNTFWCEDLNGLNGQAALPVTTRRHECYA
jgi:hypothetical protein